MLPTVGNDEPLVRSYLEHFFVDAAGYDAYLPYINDQYLKQLFAETKIVNGLGDAEKWYSLLPPEMYQQLKERIDLDFAFTNKTEFAPDEPVGLDLYVKNVDTLIVKVFEVNTQNFYRQNLQRSRPRHQSRRPGGQRGEDLHLQGAAAAARAAAFRLSHAQPSRRVRDRLHRQRQGQPGADPQGQAAIPGAHRRRRASVHRARRAEQAACPMPRCGWRARNTRRTRTARSPSRIRSQPGRQPIVLSLGGFSSLDFFQQEAENYRLAAAMYVDREELIARRKAQLIVRPRLTVNGTPVSLKMLEDVRLVITSTDLDGVASTKEVADFKLFDDRETVYEFQVPQRLARFEFMLKAKMQNQSQQQEDRSGRRADLRAQRNRSDRQDRRSAFRPRRRRLRDRPAGQDRRSRRPIGRCNRAQNARFHAAGARVAANRRPAAALCSGRCPASSP